MNEYNPVCLYCGKNIKGKVGQFCSKEHAELWASDVWVVKEQ